MNLKFIQTEIHLKLESSIVSKKENERKHIVPDSVLKYECLKLNFNVLTVEYTCRPPELKIISSVSAPF